MIDKLLENEIDKEVLSNECAVLLSGGVDSMSVGFAAERVGRNVTAYSFQLDIKNSYDFAKAKEVAEMMQWPFIGITIDTSSLKSDFLKLVELGCYKKSHFECTYPFLHIYPQIKEKYVVSGWAADGYYGISKTAILHYKHTKDTFDKFRNNYFSKNMRAGYKWHKRVADMYDKIFITPYLTESVRDYFYPMDWKEVNKPKQKHHVRNAYPQFQNIKVKDHLNLQLDSDIDKLFETLLDDKEINFKNRSRILDISKDWNKTGVSSLKEFL